MQQMNSKEVLDIVLRHSDTMIIEWADSKDGPGKEIIEETINVAILPVQPWADNEEEDKRELELIKQNVRCFVLMDMTIMGW